MIHHYLRIARAIAIIGCCLLGFVAIVATGGSSGNGKGDDNGSGDRPPSAYEQLGATVKSLKFYEGGRDNVSLEDRQYGIFQENTARYVFFELSLEYPAPGREIKFTLDFYVNGERRTSAEFTVPPAWTGSIHTSGYGSNTPGNWPAGEYTVNVHDSENNDLIASGSFTVSGEEPSGPDRELYSVVVEPSDESQYFGSENDVGIIVPGYMLQEPAQLSVTRPGTAPETDAEIAVENIYRVSLGGLKELSGVLEIEIPYDPSKVPHREAVEDHYGALYYDDDSESWQQTPYEIDPLRNMIVIHTVHLSSFATVRRVSTTAANPMAVIPQSAFYYLPSSAYTVDQRKIADLLDDMDLADGTPGASAFRAGWDAAVAQFGVTGVEFTFYEEVLGATSFTRVNNVMGDLGMALAFVQLALELDRETPAPAVLNFSKSTYNYAIGKWGTSAMKIASIGVFIIDYSLNKFATEAIAQREEIYERAYSLYYSDPSMSSPTFKIKRYKDWYAYFYDLISNAKKDDDIEKIIMDAVDDYVYNYWNDSEGLENTWIAVGGTGSFSGGLNEALKKKLSENHKWLLVSGFQPIFDRLARQVRVDLVNRYLNKESRQAANILNSRYNLSVNVTSRSKKIEDLPVKIETQRNQPLWAGVTDSDGRWRMPFTLLGFSESEATGKVILSGLGERGNETLEQSFRLEYPPQPVQIDFNLDDDDDIDDYNCGWTPDMTSLRKIDFGRNMYYVNDLDQLHGPSFTWFDATRSQLKSAWCNYENKTHGVSTEWYENGNKKEVTVSEYGQKHGPFTEWYENGNKAREGTYQKPFTSLHGKYMEWWENGNNRVSGNYNLGQRNGSFTTWYENGVKESEGGYDNGPKTGTWRYWHDDGRCRSVYDYDKSKELGCS